MPVDKPLGEDVTGHRFETCHVAFAARLWRTVTRGLTLGLQNRRAGVANMGNGPASATVEELARHDGPPTSNVDKQVTDIVIRLAVPALVDWHADLSSDLVVALAGRGNQLGAIVLGSGRPRAAAVDRVAAVCSTVHDLKNALAAISARAELLRGSARGPVPGRTESGLGQIAASARHATRLCDTLLDVVGSDAPANRWAPPSTDLAAIAHAVVADYQHLSGRHNVHLTADGGVPVIGPWDPTQMERLLGNLVHSALSQSPVGGDIGVVLRHERRESRDWAVVEVGNPGRGLGDHDRARVAGTLWPVGDRGAVPGTALGLMAARAIVGDHGGRLVSEDQPTGGGVVTVFLPTRRSAGEPDVRTPGRQPAS
jgi:signal transduction histidine kinase